MAQAARKPEVTYAEYLALEASTRDKHEFHQGEIFAMAGGTPAHAHLCGEVHALLRASLGRVPCRAFNSELRIYVPEIDEACYPDASIIGGKLTHDPRDAQAATHPVALVEVLSATTEKYDRGGKFEAYRHLPSLRDDVLVSQDHNRVEHFAKNDDGSWTFRVLLAGDTLRLSGAAATVAVDELYADVDELRASAVELKSEQVG